jgi:hypothetical protein
VMHGEAPQYFVIEVHRGRFEEMEYDAYITVKGLKLNLMHSFGFQLLLSPTKSAIN